MEDDSASHDVKDTRNSSGIIRRLQIFGRYAFDLVTTKVKMATLQVRDSVSTALKILKEKGVIGAAKDLIDWIKLNPWNTALIVVPLVSIACTAIALLAVGFGPGGIAAGSTAAAIQAGIGNVVAHSMFATCTSAMMGGYGAPIIFGGTWLLATAATAAARNTWKWWNSPKERHLVRVKAGPSNDILKSFDKATNNLILGSTMIVAFVVYYVKSTLQARKGPQTKRD